MNQTDSTPIPDQVFGERGRVGLIAPSTCERAAKDFYQAVPDDIGLIIATLAVSKISSNDVELALKGIETAAKQLADTGADIVFSAGIPLVLEGGIEADRRLKTQITSVSGLPSITDLNAALLALAEINATRIVLCTPFDTPTTDRIAEVLGEAGIEVLGSVGAGKMKQKDYALLKNGVFADMAYELVSANPKADAVYIPCGRIGDIRLTDALENRCRRPAITANGLFIWWALKTLKVNNPIEGYGKLLTLL